MDVSNLFILDLYIIIKTMHSECKLKEIVEDVRDMYLIKKTMQCKNTEHLNLKFYNQNVGNRSHVVYKSKT